MIDKEKIEKGLRCCIEGDHCNSTDCPYYDAAPNIQGCTQALCQDALVLLKEQEAVVRCRECKWHEMRGEMLLCKAQDKPHTYDWYCADVERRGTE